MICPKCGAKLEDGIRICPVCGKNLTATSVGTVFKRRDLQDYDELSLGNDLDDTNEYDEDDYDDNYTDDGYVDDDNEDDYYEEDDEVKIISTKKFGIKPMYPEDACVQMELLGHNFFVFFNAETEQVNVVYKRKGNTYGLIEPEF